MKTFTKLNLVSKIKNSNTGEIVEIYKFRKDGTKREFFAPEFEGKKLTSTLWARLYDAEKLAKQFLNRAA